MNQKRSAQAMVRMTPSTFAPKSQKESKNSLREIMKLMCMTMTGYKSCAEEHSADRLCDSIDHASGGKRKAWKSKAHILKCAEGLA